MSQIQQWIFASSMIKKWISLKQGYSQSSNLFFWLTVKLNLSTYINILPGKGGVKKNNHVRKKYKIRKQNRSNRQPWLLTHNSHPRLKWLLQLYTVQKFPQIHCDQRRAVNLSIKNTLRPCFCVKAVMLWPAQRKHEYLHTGPSSVVIHRLLQQHLIEDKEFLWGLCPLERVSTGHLQKQNYIFSWISEQNAAVKGWRREK